MGTMHSITFALLHQLQLLKVLTLIKRKMMKMKMIINLLRKVMMIATMNRVMKKAIARKRVNLEKKMKTKRWKKMK